MKSLFHKRSARSTSAFTIVELLVAITITAAITTLMVTIVVNVLNAWSRSSATLSVGNQARVIMDRVAADIEGAILQPSSDVMFAATIQLNQSGDGDAQITSAEWTGTDLKPGNTPAPNGSLRVGNPDPADRDLAEYRFGQAGVWLRLLTVPPDGSSNALDKVSAPRAVSYQIVRKELGTSSGVFSYQFFRSEVRPYGTSGVTTQKSTFANGYNFYGANGYNNPSLPSGGNTEFDAGTIRQPVPEQLLGDGVIDFGVRVFSRSATGVLEETFPVDRRGGGSITRQALAATTDLTKTHPAFASGTPSQISFAYPTVVEVMVRILTPNGVEIIQSYEQDPTRYGGATASKWWELAEANSRVYIRRVEIKSTGF